MRVRISIAFLLLLIVVLAKAIRSSSGTEARPKASDPAVQQSTQTATSQPKSPEDFLKNAQALMDQGKTQEALTAAQIAAAMARKQGKQGIADQAQALIKLSSGPSRPGQAASKLMLTENAEVLGSNPNLNAAMNVMTSRSETGTSILKEDYGVKDPARLRTLQEVLGDKFIVRTDKTGRLNEKGVEITKGTGQDAGKIILTFDTKTLDDNQPRTIAPLLGQALREAALTRDAEGKSFFSRVLTQLDGTMHKIWIAVEVKDPGKAFEGTALGKTLNYLIWVWEDDFKNKSENSCPNCELDNAQLTHQGFQTKEQLWNVRGVTALYQVISEENRGVDTTIASIPEYQVSITQVPRQLTAKDATFRDRHSLPELPND